MAEEKRIEFTPPAALLKAIGQAVRPGQHLRNMRTEFAVKPNGDWCIVRVEGVAFPGYDQDGNEKNGKEEGGGAARRGQFAAQYQQAMNGGNGGGGYGST